MSTDISFFVYWGTSNPTQNVLFTDFIKKWEGQGHITLHCNSPHHLYHYVLLQFLGVQASHFLSHPLSYRTVLIIWSSLLRPLEISEKPSSCLHAKLSLNQVWQFLMFAIWEQANIMAWIIFTNNSGISLVYEWSGMWLEPGTQVKIISRGFGGEKEKTKLIYWFSVISLFSALPLTLHSSKDEMRLQRG